jgi:hypothetical protein
MRRRILAITLLIAFGFPLVAPLLAATADPEASLPPCCRTHGAHHCAMMHSMMLALSGEPAFVPLPCPFYPAPATPVRIATASLDIAQPPSVALFRTSAPLPATPRRAARTFLASANLKRGPPALLG